MLSNHGWFSRIRMVISLVTHLTSPSKILSTSNELRVDERNKHSKINKMHVPTILYGYNVQAFRLPFTTRHSPSLPRTISTTDQQRQEYNMEDSDEKHYYYGYSIPRQLSYSNHTSSFLGSVDSSTSQAMGLHLLLALAE